VVAAARPGGGPPRPYHFPEFQEGKVDNGARLIVCPIPKLPLATLLVLTDCGSVYDAQNREGTARLTARLLVEGTRSRSGSELSEELERIGTSFDTGADWDSSIVKTTFLAKHLSEVTGLLGEVLLEPTFPERELHRLKSERIADLLQIESEPRALADEAFESFLYSAKSRYALPSGGSKTSVAQIVADDVSRFHETAYSPARTTFIAAGDLSFSQVQDHLSRRFAKWTSRKVSVGARSSDIAYTSRRLRIVNKTEAPQSELRLGHAGIPRNHPDYFPVLVMNAILGGLFGSRINLNLREAHGYTYGASSYFDWRREAGPFVISTAVQTEVTAAALKEIFSEIDRMREEPVSPSELSLAKDYLDGVFPIRYETTASVAAALANFVVHDLPPNHFDTYRSAVQSVTVEQVLEAARAHLHPSLLQTLIVGDSSAIVNTLTELDVGELDVAPMSD
jgi:zinc protease